MDEDDSLSDYWRDVKAASQEKRAGNRMSSAEILKSKGIAFESKSFGVHLIVRHAGKTVDFWPGTGKWIIRGGPSRGCGVKNLLRQLGA